MITWGIVVDNHERTVRIQIDFYPCRNCRCAVRGTYDAKKCGKAHGKIMTPQLTIEYWSQNRFQNGAALDRDTLCFKPGTSGRFVDIDSE